MQSLELISGTSISITSIYTDLICRYEALDPAFLLKQDALAFVSSLRVAMKQPGRPQADEQGKAATLVHAVVTGLRVDMPRSSTADDLYVLRLARLQLLLPASAAHLAAHLAPGQGATLRTPPTRRRSSGPTSKFDHEFLAMFELDAEAPQLVMALATSLSIHWLSCGGASDNREAQVVRGADIVTSFSRKRGCTRIHVRWPWMHTTFGEVQYALLMGIIFQNAAEPGTFRGPARRPPRPGTTPPPASSQPEVLGVSAGDAMQWELRIEVPSALVLVEGPAAQGFLVGFGPPVANVKLRGLEVVVSKHQSTCACSPLYLLIPFSPLVIAWWYQPSLFIAALFCCTAGLRA